ncbi:phosphoribosylglycinamide formyltransferase [Methylophilales bacterium MBRSG12]|uniref:Formate-dependent phosphoribosylglycinamide formyltransferase n=1 Tax=Methylophilales bacterium MBRS-H7 TaxID=1623450 RepID=A0A0H4J2L8_9PROT|nr:phosphoribosylglycinamide formyltransferase [Methylophilales bacterium MBRSF5]AKO66255.1 phosphoribosylglycinamide formyltransferase [Methylophilales bacterium MBRS-H7]AKO67573.1 phosphoribosylglycinamide formyltransferase [Methylophilales bacterium MBRSG12]
MQFTTPLKPNSTKVMLLGSGELGKEVVISLQRLGMEVIAVDRYENAPGHQVAHRAYSIDMTDAAALEQLIQQEKPTLVVPEIEAINTKLLEKLEADNVTKVIPNVRAVQLTMNREGIRKLAAEDLTIPTSPYAFASSCDELKEAVNKVGLPCFIKPTMSSSGKGQSRITSMDDVERAWEYAATTGRVNEGVVIAEGQIDFDYEITLLTVRSLNSDGNIITSYCEPIGHRQEDGDYVESWQPQPMNEKALIKSKEIAEKVTSALGGLGLFGVELFIKEDQVWFSEVSPRPHDTGMVTMITQKQSEFELHAKAILGLPVDTSLSNPGASAVIYGGHDCDAISFENIPKALADKGLDIRLFGKPQSFKKRRMGVILAHADDIQEARNKAQQARSQIKTKPV